MDTSGISKQMIYVVETFRDLEAVFYYYTLCIISA